MIDKMEPSAKLAVLASSVIGCESRLPDEQHHLKVEAALDAFKQAFTICRDLIDGK